MDFPLKLQSSSSQILTPTNVAIFSSVGLHAVILGFMLPNLSNWSNPDQNANKQNVGVIELNEAEQSRLPNTSPFTNNNPFPSSTSVLPSALPNDPLLGNPGVNLPPIAEAPLPSTNYNSFSSQTPLPPLPQLPSYPPNLPPLSSYNNLNNIPITQSPPSLPRLPSSSQIPPRSSLPPLPNTQSYFDSIRDSQGKTPRPQFGELPPPKGTSFITAAPQNPTVNAVPNLPGMVPQPGLQGMVPQPGLQADGQETSSEDAMRNDLQWRAKLQQNNAASTDIGTLNLVGAYPREACSTRAEGRVVYNVLPSGEIAQIQASRYSLFNQLARQSFQSQRFTQPTRVIVNFNYDPKVCTSTVTTPNLPGSPNESPGVPPSGSNNAGENVSPVNDPTRNVPQLPSLVPGSKTPDGNSTRVNPEQNTLQNNRLTSPTRILRPNSPVTPTAPAIAPSPVSTPSGMIKTPSSETPTTPINPAIPKNSIKYGPSPQGTNPAPTGITPDSKLEVKPEVKPEIKPEEKTEVKPTTDRNPPAPTNGASQTKPQLETKPSLAPKPVVTPSPTASENPFEKLRSRFFPPQQRVIPKAEPTPTQSNTPTMGPSNPKADNNPVGPAVGKKE